MDSPKPCPLLLLAALLLALAPPSQCAPALDSPLLMAQDSSRLAAAAGPQPHDRRLLQVCGAARPLRRWAPSNRATAARLLHATAAGGCREQPRRPRTAARPATPGPRPPLTALWGRASISRAPTSGTPTTPSATSRARCPRRWDTVDWWGGARPYFSRLLATWLELRAAHCMLRDCNPTPNPLPSMRCS